jgi:hypothetical protein
MKHLSEVGNVVQRGFKDLVSSDRMFCKLTPHFTNVTRSVASRSLSVNSLNEN